MRVGYGARKGTSGMDKISSLVDNMHMLTL